MRALAAKTLPTSELPDWVSAAMDIACADLSASAPLNTRVIPGRRTKSMNTLLGLRAKYLVSDSPRSKSA